MRPTLLRNASRLVGGMPGFVVAELLRRRRGNGRRWRWISGAVAAVTIVVIAVVASFPLIIADTAASWLLGGRTDALGNPVPHICSAPPAATSSVAEPPEPGLDAAPGGPEIPPGPAAALDADERPTAAGLAAISSVPAGVDIGEAQGWILFQLTHPGGAASHPAAADFDTFVGWYRHTADLLSPQASALDVVMSIDPAADYSPDLLLSQAAVYRMMRQGSVTFTEKQRDALIQQLASTCRGPNGDGSS